MRITFVTPPPTLSGGARVIATYAQGLRARGHDVVIVYPRREPPRLRERLRAWLRGGAAALSAASHFDHVDVPQRPIEGAPPFHDEHLPDADILIGTWWATVDWCAGLSRAKGAPVFFAQGYETLPGETNPAMDRVWSMPIPKIVVSRWLQDLARDRFGDPDAVVVPNSVDTALFQAPARGKNPRPVVGVMYAAAPFRGCDLVFDAFERARAALPGLRLVSFGAKPPIPALPLPNGTDFALKPEQSTIKDIYARCDAWLFASRQEGFGLPVLEAMACRTPVIATPAGAAPELLEHGGGMLVPHEDPEAMADAVLRVCRMSDAEWRALSDAAYAAAGRYTWDSATDAFERALLRVAREAPSP